MIMKYTRLYIFFSVLMCGVAHGAGLLQPASFPKTADDLTFVQNINLQSAGYEPWESEYDATGRCISGCAYNGITIQRELQNLENNTYNARRALSNYISHTPSNAAVSPSVPTKPATPQQIIVQNTPRCTPYHPEIPAAQSIPLGVPLTGNPRITSPYGERIHPITGNRSVHKGVNFSAPIGTSVFSPAAGTIGSVWRDSTCGNGLKISHTGGYETVYCHLNKVTVKQGDVIGAGCVVAETGNTGRTTGPHLHYGIKYNGEYINPTDWLVTP